MPWLRILGMLLLLGGASVAWAVDVAEKGKGVLVASPVASADVQPASASSSRIPWLIYYGDNAPRDGLGSFDVIVLDVVRGLPIRDYVSNNKMVFAYLSPFQIHPKRWYYDEVLQRKLAVPSGQVGDPLMVDIRQPEWIELMIEEIVPSLLFRGANGVMIDSVAPLLALEKKNPALYGGMRDAAIDLVLQIHAHYPKLALMVSDGDMILPEIAPHIHAVMLEGGIGRYSPQRQGYGLLADGLIQKHLSRIQSIKQAHPKLTVFTLDYADPADENSRRKILSHYQPYPVHPYVGDADLLQIVPTSEEETP